MPTLPTIHNNGTGLRDLITGYDNAAEKLREFQDALSHIEFNARDYYPQGPNAWTAALAERQQLMTDLQDADAYLDAIRTHLHDTLYEPRFEELRKTFQP